MANLHLTTLSKLHEQSAKTLSSAATTSEKPVTDNKAPSESPAPKKGSNASTTDSGAGVPERKREPWQIQKAALKKKFGNERWNPRKRLSPDTIEGIRVMHASDPERFSTPILAEHFKVSPEAIRRILKSKWRPKPEEQERRRERWERRGERIWSQLAELGVKPPKTWRLRGIGKAEPGEMPLWKSGGRRPSKGASSSQDATTVRRDLIAERPSTSAPAASVGLGRNISNRIL
ncbi:uncharacterized protein PV09_02814 [Verruconis gallopava]|uniref:Required for respiratory growth protein 9, mitochondrial n=1 Tax=Verruconis gallopava TaxID=253628 RepID=A0A0D1Z064_9PEZI|nr:uncharacterized protein PV09_02814 [Verruconis gallopava]KIW06352.1 hypothetical protein PV09_02814 [Verruconis gallopava]